MTNVREVKSRQTRQIAGALSSLLLLACGVQWAVGQGAAPAYFVAPIDKSFMTVDKTTGAEIVNERARKEASAFKNQILIGTTPYTQQSADQFKKWYTGYQFRAFSQLDALHKLPERRKEIVDDLKRARAKDVHDDLRKITEQYMKVYVTAKQNFHPAVRFNAMLLIGDLNADEQNVIANLRYPNPLPEALDFMLEQYQNPTQLDAVKLAALIGITRHVQLNRGRPEAAKIPAAKQQKIAELMLALVNSKEPPPGRLPEGHVWLQRRGLEILAEMGLIGVHDATTQAVTNLVRDHNADLTLRCTAAKCLSKTMLPKAPAKSKIDPAQQSLQLAALLVESCHSELNRMDAWYKKKMGLPDSAIGLGGDGTKSGMMPGMGGMMPGMGSGMMPGMGSGMMPGMGGMGSGMMPGMGSGMGSGMMPGMGGGLMPGGYGMEDGASGMMASSGPKDPLVELFRRQLKYEIDCARDGMNGVAKLVPAEKGKVPFAELNADIDLVWKATNPPAGGSNIPYLYKSLKDSLKGLETKTAALLPKPKPPVDESTELAGDVPADIPPAAVGVQPAGGVAPAGAAAVGVNPGAVPPAAARNPGAAPAAAANADIPPDAPVPAPAAAAPAPAAGGAPAAGAAPAAGGAAPPMGAAGAAPGKAAPQPDLPPGT